MSRQSEDAAYRDQAKKMVSDAVRIRIVTIGDEYAILYPNGLFEFVNKNKAIAYAKKNNQVIRPYVRPTTADSEEDF